MTTHGHCFGKTSRALLKLNEDLLGTDVATSLNPTVLLLTQHSTSHQDVKKCFGIAAVVELGTRGIKELSDGVQISASLVQTLYNTFLKLGRIKSLLFI